MWIQIRFSSVNADRFSWNSNDLCDSAQSHEVQSQSKVTILLVRNKKKFANAANLTSRNKYDRDQTPTGHSTLNKGAQASKFAQ